MPWATRNVDPRNTPNQPEWQRNSTVLEALLWLWPRPLAWHLPSFKGAHSPPSLLRGLYLNLLPSEGGLAGVPGGRQATQGDLRGGGALLFLPQGRAGAVTAAEGRCRGVGRPPADRKQLSQGQLCPGACLDPTPPAFLRGVSLA